MLGSGDAKQEIAPTVVEAYSPAEMVQVRIVSAGPKSELTYEVIEPALDPDEERLLYNLKTTVEGILPALLARASRLPSSLSESILRFTESRKIIIPENSLNKILYYIKRDYLGYGIIDPLVLDNSIEDISCDGPGIPIYVYHSKYETLKTNRSFKDHQSLDSFVIKLSQLCGKQVSVSNPILDGITPQSHRVQGVYGREISSRGSAFTIRLFRQRPFGPIDLLDFGTCDSRMLAYLWIMVETLSSCMVAGPPGSGKTSTLNAILSYAPPNTKIVSLEETRELNLEHPTWVPTTTRTAEASGSGIQEFSLFDLVKSAMRQRPTYIVVGEIRGEEAYALFQAMSTGHTTLSTVHADSMDSLVNRLISEPMNIPKMLIPSLNIVIFVNFIRKGDALLRRVTEIDELMTFETRNDQILYNTVFSYDPNSDSFRMSHDSQLMEKFARFRGVAQSEAWLELEKRASILERLKGRRLKYGDFWSEIRNALNLESGRENV